MEKLGILTTSLLLTASLLFYTSRPHSDIKTEEVQTQQQIITSFSQKGRKHRWFSPFFMKVKSFVVFF